MTEEKFIKTLQKCYFGEKDAFNEIVAIFIEKDKENKRLKEVQKKLDCVLEMLVKWSSPCELDGFMDKHSDYCEKNCSVDEEVFKKCWLMYIENKLKDEVE